MGRDYTIATELGPQSFATRVLMERPQSLLADAIEANDALAVARVLEDHPELRAHIDEPAPRGAFGQTALLAAVQRRNRDMVDVLLRAGANINQKSHWWAGGFHAL